MNDACQTEMKASKLEKCLEPRQLTMCCGSLKSMIVYPYPIDESKIHIKISKKKAKISVTVQRASSLLPNDKTTYFIDTRNRLTHPKFQCDATVMDKYCNLQSLYRGQDHPLFNAKRSFTDLLKHALDGRRVFTFSFPSKRFDGAHALVYVHGLRFSTVLNSPLLEVSYCFLDTKTQHMIHVLQTCLGPTCDIMVDNVEHLNDVFEHFSCTMRHPFPKDLNKITKTIVEHNLWEHFTHAVLFPLYPNPSNPRFVDETAHPRGLSADSLTQALMMNQGSSTTCSLCGVPSTPVKCEQCQARYCSKECQEMDRNVHRMFCNLEEVARSLVKQLFSEVASENPETATTDPCATGSTSRSKTQSDAEAQSDDPKQDHSGSLCARCKKPGTIVCKCQQVYYCSSACQTLELPVHSKKCSQPSHHHPAPGNQSSTSSAKADKIQKHSSACARCNKPASLICRCQQVSYCSKECQRLEWPNHSDTCKKPTGKSLSELHSPAEKPNNPNPEEVARSHVKLLSSPENPETATTDPCATGSTSRSKTQSDAEAQSDDPKQDHSGSLCARCKKPGTIVCKCQQVYYCSSACQTLELPVHSKKCSQPSHHHPAPGNQSSTSSAKADKIQKHSSACARCNKPASLICRCQQVSYCSKECQRLEWPNHSDTCKKPTGKSLSELHSPAEKPKGSEASKKAPDSEASKTAPDDKVPKKASLTLDPEKCSNCNKMKSSLKKCKCRNASYCSVECQRLYWPQHKSTCTAVQRK